MKIFKIVLSLTLILPMLASATSLHIYNQTKKDLSFSVNQQCSSEFGVILPRTSSIISQVQLNLACEKNRKTCEVYIVNSSNCHGEFVAKAIVNTKTGIMDIPEAGQFLLTWNESKLYITAPEIK